MLFFHFSSSSENFVAYAVTGRYPCVLTDFPSFEDVVVCGPSGVLAIVIRPLGPSPTSLSTRVEGRI